MASEICLWLRSVARRGADWAAMAKPLAAGKGLVFIGIGWMGGDAFERWLNHQMNSIMLAVIMAPIIGAYIFNVRVLLWPNSDIGPNGAGNCGAEPGTFSRG